MVGPPPPPPSKTRKRNRQSADTGGGTKRDDTGSSQRTDYGKIIFMILLAGLIISCLSVVFIMNFVHQEGFHLSSTSSQKQQQQQQSSISTIPPDVYEKKKEIFDLLVRARLKLSDLDEETIAELPTWEEITALYGPKPIIYGLDRCDTFQELTQSAGFVSTAGTFNSGTNLMAELLIGNCHLPQRMKRLGYKNRGVRWQVPWGKHTPLGDEEFRRTHKVDADTPIDADEVLPAVTLRDPLTWLKSMCHIPYGAKWMHNARHCPDFSGNNLTTRVKYKEFWRKHDSILGLWNDFYRAYLEVPWPRLLVRIEDLIYHPEETTEIVCKCAGGAMREDGKFVYIVNSAKKGERAHGKVRTGMVDAIIKYGTFQKRYEGYFSHIDLKYIRDHVDPELMEMMKYAPINPLNATKRSFWNKFH